MALDQTFSFQPMPPRAATLLAPPAAAAVAQPPPARPTARATTEAAPPAAAPPAAAATSLQRVMAGAEMTPLELAVVRAYCARVAPPGVVVPLSDAAFDTRRAFLALGAAFSHWCAEALVTGQDMAHGELLMRSALYNHSLAMEMKQRYAALEATNNDHVKEIAALRAHLAAKVGGGAPEDALGVQTPQRRRLA